MQRDPKTYEDPLEFRPERFESANASQNSPFAWVVFSAGPRNCIGSYLIILAILYYLLKYLGILKKGKYLLIY